MRFSEENKQIATALAKAWAKIENPKFNKKVTVRTKNGGKYDFEYTDLNGVLEVARPVFREQKISIHQDAFTEDYNGRLMVIVETTFLHESGEWMCTSPLRYPVEKSMQDVGGQITYMKRYSLSAALGIGTEADDDGNAASGNQVQYHNTQPQKMQYRQEQPTGYFKKQQNNQQHQKPPVNNDGEKLMTDQQYQRIKYLLQQLGGSDLEEQRRAFEAAAAMNNLPEGTKVKQMVFTQAEGVIFYLNGVLQDRQSRQQQGS